MTGPLFSQHWHRVRGLRLKLRKHVSLHRHEYRGEPWYVLHDSLTGQVHRFTPQAYQVIGRLDGKRSLDDVWKDACVALGDEMPTQHEMVSLLGRLHNANVLSGYGDIDIDELFRRQTRLERSRWLQMIRSPLGVRIPLLDPDRFVTATYPFVRPLIGVAGGLLWLSFLVVATVLALVHWQELTENMADRVLGAGNLLLLAFIYPVIKTLHELGHAWTTKDAGGEVHEIGIMLLVFFPVPYVDATAAAACPDKHRRMLVSAAGIMVELFLASLAMFVWVVAEPGIVRALAFNVMLIAGVSTLLFNGNPLLRFDAYYVLADYLEIPNLYGRANQQVFYLVKRYLLGRSDVISQAGSVRESLWLFTYAITSFLYRLFIMIAIAIFVSTRYLFVGVLLAIWSLSMTLLLPFIKMIKAMFSDENLEGSRFKVWSWFLGSLATVFGLMFFVPVPYSTVLDGVVESREPAQIRLPVSGELTQLWVDDGDVVEPGQRLLQVDTPELAAQVDRLVGQRRQVQQQLLANVRDTANAQLLQESLALLDQRLVDARQRASSTTLISTHEGVLRMPDGVPPLGTHLERGEPVALLIRPEDLRIRTMIPTHRAERVRDDARDVTVRDSSSQESLPASIRWVSPRSSYEIPSSALTVEGGGEVALDPASGESMRSFRRHYLADISVGHPVEEYLRLRLGQRVHVRISHTPEPYGMRLMRDIRRSFLRLFDV